MKQLVLPILLLFCLVVNVQAQDCMPDPTGIPDTAFGVYPLPFIADERPDGGITDTVCLNRDFEYTLNIKIGDTLSLGALTAPVNKVFFAPNGAVEILPVTAAASVNANFQYICNPPNCIFTAGSLGCVKIFGKATSADQIGQHDITIKGTIELQTFVGPITSGVEFPTPDVEALRGNYFLFVQAENSPYCLGVGSNTYAIYAPDMELKNQPNPFSDFTQIHVKSREEGRFQLRVVDMLGQVVRTRPIDVHFGENIIDFDGRDLADGLYIYTLTDGRGGVSGKMVVNHGRG